MTPLDEKRKTAANKTSNLRDARVIANYGDPGLDEDYHFDILSRYVVVMLESCDRILTKDKWFQMLAIVRRPQHLWIETEGGVATNPSNQKRSDTAGNVNVGSAGNFSVKGIPRINTPYYLGEQIKVRELPNPATIKSESDFFTSDFGVTWDSNHWLYNGWHTTGSTLPYINNDTDKVGNLRRKTIDPIANSNSKFNFYLSKYQYEAFILTLNQSNSTASNLITKIFDGTWGAGHRIYSAHGGYIFNAQTSVLLSSCLYEDINLGNKVRTGSNECIPLVVATPHTFPTPKVRATGTIAYNPSYSPVARG
jgi:hypothetical protein